MVKIIESEDEAKLAKEKLEEELESDPVYGSRDFTSKEINWVDGKELSDWDSVKEKSKDLMSESNNLRSFFLSHSNDKIVGKPQLVHPTMKTIVLLKKVVKYQTDKLGNEDVITTWKFLDEHYDKRYDGNLKWEWKQDFWVYRVTSDNREYYIFSKQQLEMKNYEFTGMTVELNDKTDINNNLKLKSVSRVFFLKDFVPTVKVLNKKDLLDLVNAANLDKETWFNLLNYHELGTINNFPDITNMIRSAQILSGKIDGWPMHLAVMGMPGTRKSFGYIENTAFKLSDDPEIVEGANSRIKGLSPSFKEKPANIGYLAKCERMGFVDELGKMVEFEINKHQSSISNVLGELNFLLDHKKRTVGSGNDNDCIVQATAKFLFASNGVKGKEYLCDHIGLIDPTTMSRIVWWIQNKEETDMVLGKNGILRIPPTPRQAQDTTEEEKKMKILRLDGGLVKVLGELSRDEFLTIFDSTNSFLCEIDRDLIEKLVQESLNRCPEALSPIWRPRAEHHIHLLLDGLCKLRCLFVDKTTDFTANDKDYLNTQAIINTMMKSWDTPVSIVKKRWSK